MLTAITDPPLTADPSRRRWTREEFERLSTEIVDFERLELVDGELITKMGKSRPHVHALIMLQVWLVQVFGVRYVQPESPIDVAPEDNPASEPEPNLIVTTRDLSCFAQANPAPGDLRLVRRSASI